MCIKITCFSFIQSPWPILFDLLCRRRESTNFFPRQTAILFNQFEPFRVHKKAFKCYHLSTFFCWRKRMTQIIALGKRKANSHEMKTHHTEWARVKVFFSFIYRVRDKSFVTYSGVYFMCYVKMCLYVWALLLLLNEQHKKFGVRFCISQHIKHILYWLHNIYIHHTIRDI